MFNRIRCFQVAGMMPALGFLLILFSLFHTSPSFASDTLFQTLSQTLSESTPATAPEVDQERKRDLGPSFNKLSQRLIGQTLMSFLGLSDLNSLAYAARGFVAPAIDARLRSVSIKARFSQNPEVDELDRYLEKGKTNPFVTSICLEGSYTPGPVFDSRLFMQLARFPNLTRLDGVGEGSSLDFKKLHSFKNLRALRFNTFKPISLEILEGLPTQLEELGLFAKVSKRKPKMGHLKSLTSLSLDAGRSGYKKNVAPFLLGLAESFTGLEESSRLQNLTFHNSIFRSKDPRKLRFVMSKFWDLRSLAFFYFYSHADELISAIPNPSNLVSLSLYAVYFGSNDLKFLSHLTQLRELSLIDSVHRREDSDESDYGKPIDPAEVFLVAPRTLEILKILSAYYFKDNSHYSKDYSLGTNLSTKGAALSEFKKLHTLKLRLRGAKIDDLMSSVPESVTFLDVDETHLSDRAGPALQRKNLVSLDLFGTKVTTGILSSLAQIRTLRILTMPWDFDVLDEKAQDAAAAFRNSRKDVEVRIWRYLQF